jgi:hypothetical protein
MVQASQVSGDHLAQAQNLYVGQGSSFNDLHSKVAAVGNPGDKPSDDLVSDTPLSFMSNRADEIAAYNQKPSRSLTATAFTTGSRRTTPDAGRRRRTTANWVCPRPEPTFSPRPRDQAAGRAPGIPAVPATTARVAAALSAAVVTAAPSRVVRVEVGASSRAHLARVVPYLFIRRSWATGAPRQRAMSRHRRRPVVVADSVTSLPAATAAAGSVRGPAVPGPVTSALVSVALAAVASARAASMAEVTTAVSAAVDRVASPRVPVAPVPALVSLVRGRALLRDR